MKTEEQAPAQLAENSTVNRLIQLRPFNFALCSTPQQLEAHTVMRDIISSNKGSTYNFDEVYDPYTDAYKTEDDAYRRVRRYEETATLAQLNTKRQKLFLYIKQVINAEFKSPVVSKKAAAERLKPLADLYRDAARMDYIAQSAAIANFLQDILQATHTADVTTLGLAAALTDLQAANDEFTEVYNLRNDTKAQNEAIEQLDRARVETDRAYHWVAQAVNSIYVANHYGKKEPLVTAAYGTIIDSINHFLSQLDLVVTSHHTRMAHKEHDPRAYSTSKAVILNHLPRGMAYKVVDIAGKTIGEGISGGTRIEISAPVGEYTVTIDGTPWEKNPVVVK